jgi:hypothetical protein
MEGRMPDITYPQEIKIPEVAGFSDKKNLAADILSGLSEEERAAVLDILKEISQEGHSEKFEDLKYADFEEIPVDIDTFLDDDNYLGQGL